MVNMKNQSFTNRVRFALSGIRYTLKAEASFRVQWIGALAALAILVMTRPLPIWWAIFGLSTGSVLAAELINTALEATVDRLHPDQHPLIARAKDCAAGAVLILSIASLGIAAALIYDWLGKSN